MTFPSDLSDFTTDELDHWLATMPSEDELRGAYLALESKRAALWQPGQLDSYRRDRYERDARYVAQLVRIKGALAYHWAASGQVQPPLAATA